MPLQATQREHKLATLKNKIVGFGGDSKSPRFFAAMEEAKHALKATVVQMEVAKRTASISGKRETSHYCF